MVKFSVARRRWKILVAMIGVFGYCVCVGMLSAVGDCCFLIVDRRRRTDATILKSRSAGQVPRQVNEMLRASQL